MIDMEMIKWGVSAIYALSLFFTENSKFRLPRSLKCVTNYFSLSGGGSKGVGLGAAGGGASFTDAGWGEAGGELITGADVDAGDMSGVGLLTGVMAVGAGSDRSASRC
jgi:hypothetical protein